MQKKPLVVSVCTHHVQSNEHGHFCVRVCERYLERPENVSSVNRQCSGVVHINNFTHSGVGLTCFEQFMHSLR